MNRPFSSSSLGPESRCTGCGATVDGGTVRCAALYHEVIARELGDTAYFSVHRLTEATYSLQHPEDYAYTPKLLASALATLCWQFTYRGRPEVGDALTRWLGGSQKFEGIVVPHFRGGGTILDVYAATNASNHAKRVRRWSGEVWDAWIVYHGVVQGWIESAINNN